MEVVNIFISLMLQDIGSRKECNQFTETKCRTVFDTSSEERWELSDVTLGIGDDKWNSEIEHQADG